MVKETESVIDYLSGNKEELVEYFAECNKEEKLPNYSEFCRKYLNGETKEGISFTNIKIQRKILTSYMRDKYRMWQKLI